MCTDSPSIQIGTNPSDTEAPVNQDLALPPLGDLDLGVIEGLPPDLFSEINDMYDGKLINLISKKKGKNVDASNSLCSMRQERVQVAINEGKGPFWLDPACVNESPVEDKEENCPIENNQGEPASEAGPSNSVFFTSVPNKIDLMPSLLSQVDISVLQQLPKELRVDILEVLPAHRRPECTSDATLKFLADMYYRSGSRGRLSSILQCTLSESELHSDASNDGWDDAIGCLCDLLKQYIKLQIETDIEEIYVCFHLLRRFTTKSKFFFQVYNVVFPYLQDLDGTVICILASSAVVNSSDANAFLHTFWQTTECRREIVISRVHEPNRDPSLIMATVITAGSEQEEVEVSETAIDSSNFYVPNTEGAPAFQREPLIRQNLGPAIDSGATPTLDNLSIYRLPVGVKPSEELKNIRSISNIVHVVGSFR